MGSKFKYIIYASRYLIKNGIYSTIKCAIYNFCNYIVKQEVFSKDQLADIKFYGPIKTVWSIDGSSTVGRLLLIQSENHKVTEDFSLK